MLTLRRRRSAREQERPGQLAEFRGSDEQLADEIERLTEGNRKRETPERDRRLLQLRNQAGIRLVEAAGGAPPHPEPDFAALPAGDGLPEFTLGEVTPGLLRAAILRDGCLLVRGLMPRTEAVRMAGKIERSFGERERYDGGQRFDASYYQPFAPDPRLGVEVGRQWIKNGGGVLAVDAPALSFELFELFTRSGVADLVAGYLGELPLVTVHKSTLRKAEPTVAGAWHQDGKFMGEVRALNLWLSLSHCGDEAPGLDIVPRRIDHHVTTQTDEAWLDHAVSQRMAEEAAGDTSILRPIFEPGDALLFDELFLHKTGSDPSMPRARLALENWFFGPSGFPADYAPLVV
jgi:hypothetical protein